MSVIETKELAQWLEKNPSWTKAHDEIQAHYKFKNFIEAFGFLARVAILAEKHNHHPRIENTYNNVILSLTTHDAGNKITNKDLELAQEIESLK